MIGRANTLRVLSLVAFVGLWWGAALIARNRALLPAPPEVLGFVWSSTLSGSLPRNIAITSLRVAAAFVISMFAGSAMGYVAGRSSQADTFIDPWLVILLNFRSWLWSFSVTFGLASMMSLRSSPSLW